MATELIASGSTQSSIVDVTVTAGTPVKLMIYFTAGEQGVRYALYSKSSANAYQKFETLTPENIADKGLLVGGGVYGVQRLAASNASSIEKD